MREKLIADIERRREEEGGRGIVLGVETL